MDWVVVERSGTSQPRPNCEAPLDEAGEQVTLLAASNETASVSFDLPRGERDIENMPLVKRQLEAEFSKLVIITINI